MRTHFSQSLQTIDTFEEDFSPLPTLREDLEKTRIALEIAYAGFDNAVEIDMIDCYIYEINSLLKRYKYLSELASLEQTGNQDSLYQKPSVRTLFRHVFS